MYQLKKLYGDKFERFNEVIEGLNSGINKYINLVGSSTLPFPEVCQALSYPANAIRVEGHIEERYFPGTEAIDSAEEMAINGVRRIFNIDEEYEISVQPHSATQANHIIWKTFLNNGDNVLGLCTNSGGHISHNIGLPAGVNFIPFSILKTGIDYEHIDSIVKSNDIKMIIAGSTSYPLIIDYDKLGLISKKYNVYLHADIAHTAPYEAAYLHSRSISQADSITIDTSKNLRGPKGGILVYKKKNKKIIERTIFPILQSSPNQSAIIAKACLFEIWDTTSITLYANKLVRIGRVLSNQLIRNNIPLVFGRTDTHIILIDVNKLGFSGKAAEELLENIGILVNRNPIPNDNNPPWLSSGIRIGVSIMAILDYEESDVIKVANIISSALKKEEYSTFDIDSILEKYHGNLSVIS